MHWTRCCAPQKSPPLYFFDIVMVAAAGADIEPTFSMRQRASGEIQRSDGKSAGDW